METNSEEYILTIGPKYIPTWGKWEAFRELMQNCIDRSNEYERAEIIFSYNEVQQRIILGNKLSFLPKKTLVLGVTDKDTNENAIGQYGEGYKLALLVFLRMGVRIRIRTGNEVWIPSITHSLKFETEVLVITALKTAQIDNLVFEIDGITPEDYKLFKSNCLVLNTIDSKLKTDMGDILMDEQYRSKLFVEGLFVCTFAEKEKIRYGYNMKSRYIALDRDRRKVSSFNLLWEVGRMFHLLDSTYANMIYSLQKEGYKDAVHYENHILWRDNPLYQAICSLHHDDFVAKYGKKSIPVNSEEEANFVREKYNDLVPVVLKTIEYRYVTESAAYKSSSKSKVRKEDTPYSITKRLLTKHLAGKENKAARDILLEELLPLTREWFRRS